LVLFFCQRLGTGRIGNSFGPILLLWFLVIAVLGAVRVVQNPIIIAAVNPYYGFKFFYLNGWQGYKLLGGVFLVITGAEALYADLGHFGKTPIRIAWFAVALPALLLNYFGQGAYLLRFPTAIANPFYAASPLWFTYPLIILAAAATIIASQAVISASFSLAKQAMLLDLCPRFVIVQTSSLCHGQIYVPKINAILAIGTVFLVLFFENSTSLAGAYGIAVNLVMIIVSIFVMMVASQDWDWSWGKIVRVFSVFVLIDLAFLGGNLHKVLEGGWMPLVFAAICAFLMITWNRGIQLLRSSHFMSRVALKEVINEFNHADLYYLPKAAAIFITDPDDQSGGSFLHYLKSIQVLPENILLVSVKVAKYPYITEKKSYKVSEVSQHIYRLTLRFGFMQTIDVPQALRNINKMGALPFVLDLNNVLYLIETIEINVTGRRHRHFTLMQKKIFKRLLRGSAVDFKFFHLPHTRTISLGTSCDL
jgi:KUP system potassium uptake protein